MSALKYEDGVYVMLEEKINELRERLHLLINENADYHIVLKASEELDDIISEYTAKELKEDKSSQRKE